MELVPDDELLVHPTFDTAFKNVLNAISERTCCHKVLFYVAN